MTRYRHRWWLGCGWIVLACAGRMEADRAAVDEVTATGGKASTSYPMSSGGAAPIASGGSATSSGGTEDPPPSAWCGNGVLNVKEECDDGNRSTGDGCTEQCLVEYTFACPTPGVPCVWLSVCGDGAVSPYEVCDDGNRTDNDGCSSDCLEVTRGWQCRVPGLPCSPLCGDGLVVGDEACDYGLKNGAYTDASTPGCSNNCRSAQPCQLTSAPSPCMARCGDGVQSGNEQCDEGVNNQDGLYGGCTTLCHMGSFCGDGVVNGQEECDELPLSPPGYGRPGCTATCQFSHYCGDGNIDSLFGEECEPALDDDRYPPYCDATCRLIMPLL
jgi:cysteine-rich repeat protein